MLSDTWLALSAQRDLARRPFPENPPVDPNRGLAKIIRSNNFFLATGILPPRLESNKVQFIPIDGALA